jgi:type I restriction enzyme S subunit
MSKAIRFGDLIEHEIGGGWGEETPTQDSPEAAFVIRGTDIPRVMVGDVSTVPYRFHKTSSLRSRVLRPLDIVFEVSGGSKGQPVGRALLVTQGLLDRLREPVMCASFCKLIRLDPQACDPRFVFRLLQNEYVTGGLDAFQVQSTGITNFRWKPFLDQFQVALPPRSRQEQVVQVLDWIDDLIENNWRRVEGLDEMARAIYREWFVHLRYPGHEDVPTVNAALGPIPVGWTIAPLASIAEVNRLSRTPAKDETVRYLDISALSERRVGHLSMLSGVDVPGRARRIVEAGDVVWSMVRPNRRAHALLVGPKPDWIASTGLAVLSATEVSSTWLFETVSTKEFSDYLVSREGGSAYPAVKPKDFEQAPVIIPTQDVDRAFAECVAPLHRLCWALNEQSAVLTSLSDLLLPGFVTGHTDLSHLNVGAMTELVRA